MKTDNIFKFVAIRPPTAKENITRLNADDKTIKKIIDLLEEQRPEAVGSELVKGNRYFTASAVGKTLIQTTQHVEALLRAARTEPDFEGFRDKALDLLEPINPDHRTLERLLASDEYTGFKESLWISYYANVLNPNELPRDREVITSWLLFSYLLEAKTEQGFKARVKHLPHTRLCVSGEFFVPAVAPRRPEQRLAQPEDRFKRRAEQLKARIAQLQDAHHELNALFTAKLRRLEAMRPEEQQRGPAELEMGKATGQPPLMVIRGDLPQLTPWRLSDDDLEEYKPILQLAREIGIAPETSTLPEIANKIEAEIAALNAEVTAQETREDLKLVGRTFVRVQRQRGNEEE